MRARISPAGGWADLAKATETRSLPAPTVAPAWPYLAPGAPTQVTAENVLRVSDAWACIRVLSDSIASLPLHAFRRADQGRVPAGQDARIVRLLANPAPGSTGVDLISQVMTHLAIDGNAFLAKYRNGDGEIAQLGCLPPASVQVELRGQRVVYILDTIHGHTEVGPESVCHIKGLSVDGVRGVSPVAQCRVALGLSASLQDSARQFFDHGSRPSGILSAPSANKDEVQSLSERWALKHGGSENQHKVAVVSGDITFTPLAFSADDNQFLQQRDLSAREVARCFRVPAWAIDAPTGSSLTYANVQEQNRALVTHSLRPWLVRIERAITGDSDLCPGGMYVQFELDGLLRATPAERAAQYTAGLNPVTGWLNRSEVRELEDLPPEPERSRASAPEPPEETPS
jgi:HK97 family phage portal protein